MFYYLSQLILDWCANTVWEDRLSALRLFKYITVRSAGAALTALVISWWLGPRVIAWLKRVKFGQDYSDKAEVAGGMTARVLSKKGTPTMGGILIILALNLTTILWAQLNTLVLLSLLSVVVLTGLGFYDDYAKIIQQSGGGAKSKVKLLIQTILAVFIGLYLWLLPSTSKLVTEIMVPFYKHPVLTGAGLAGLVLTVLTIVGSSNAVNLTDGLDGLAVGCTLFVSFVFLILTYLAGNFRSASYLNIPYVEGAGELTVFCAAIIGAGLGFLWFNCHPAQVFMGDTGSLAIGGLIGVVAICCKQELLLAVVGGVFVIEATSVILQVLSFKLTGKRIFAMSPIHHHFELSGWKENTVIVRFWILSAVFALLGLATLKLR